jgi:hypothetical protein
VKVQTNFNVGEGITNGMDAALRFYFTDHVAIASSISLADVDTIKLRPTDPRESSQFNASTNRSSIALELTNMPRSFSSTGTIRYVKGYAFRSGVVGGFVPSYGMLDLSANYRFADGTTIILQAQNIAACVGGESVPPVNGLSSSNNATYVPGRKCGFGQKHQESLSMPALGPVVFLGARRHWR